jgi:hypothetical protein
VTIIVAMVHAIARQPAEYVRYYVTVH